MREQSDYHVTHYLLTDLVGLRLLLAGLPDEGYLVWQDGQIVGYSERPDPSGTGPAKWITIAPAG